MFSVPLVCHDEADRHPYAPFVSAEISILGGCTTVALLVDTGADHTVLDPYTAGLPKPVLQQGVRERSMGVGGRWPSRRFKDCRLTVLAEDDENVEHMVGLALPSVSVLSPFGKPGKLRDGELAFDEDLGPYAPQDRKLTSGAVRRCHQVTPLLGRDCFRENKLSLEWDPNGESAILFGEPPAVQERLEPGNEDST
jgi:hypothetical protein